MGKPRPSGGKPALERTPDVPPGAAKEGIPVSIDLHVHSSASDGTLPPAAVVQAAWAAGVTALAITDHDTMDGVAEAMAAAERLGIELVPGVELNTDRTYGEVHILGYFIPPDAHGFYSLLAQRREARVQRGLKMVERLQELGFRISFDDVLRVAGGGAITRPHVARAMVEAGCVASVQEAFQRYLYTGGPAYVPRDPFSAFDAVRAILEAGGVPVLAHPGRMTEEGKQLIPALVEHGLQGLECYYPEHSPEETEHFLALAAKYDLVVTGGTDAHGPGSGHDRRIGSVSVPPGAVEALKERRERLVRQGRRS